MNMYERKQLYKFLEKYHDKIVYIWGEKDMEHPGVVNFFCVQRGIIERRLNNGSR